MHPFVRNTFFHILLLAGRIFPGLSQSLSDHPKLTDGSNFKIIQKELNDYYTLHPKAKGYKQWKRREWFLEPRLYPSGHMENLALKTWKAYDGYIKSQHDSRSTHGSWTFLGPTSCAEGLGRLNAIAFHPSDPNVMYVGSSNGGVWKTINGGLSWSNVSPNIPLLSIADVKLSPSNPNVVYILTGDGDPSPEEIEAHGQTEISSIGILRSTDGGATWYPTGFSFEHPSAIIPIKLLIHPSNVSIQYVASQNGLYRTTDHWATWAIELNQPTFDIEFKPGNPDIMYAGSDNQMYKSTDGGDTWYNINDPDFSNMSQGSRVELAIAPNNSNVVYALAGNWNGFLAFFESQSEGNNNSWTLRNNSATSLGSFTDYCVGLAVDPTDWTDVFGGMQWINKSTNQGTVWSSIVDDFVHADIHDVAYVNGALWVCGDGGLYKSTNEGNSWSEIITGLGITEVYRIAGTPEYGNLYFMGCQDNSTMRRDGPTSTFEQVNDGDGTTCLIDYTDLDIVYASSQNGGFSKSTNSGDSFFDLDVPGTGAWISPMIMDPGNHERLFAGKNDVYRSDNGGDDWFNIFAPSSLDPVNCLAQGTSNPNRLYASTADLLARCDNALGPPGYDWTGISAGLPDLFITGIAVDPNNSARVFICYSGYDDGDKVYRSNNLGDDWINLSGSLPNIPINCIEFHENGLHNDALYIGTDIGVFYRDNELGDWIYFSNGIPAVNISDLYINPNTNTLTAGTYGRGLWRSDLYTGCVSDITLTGSSPNNGVRYYSATNSISSGADYRKDIGTETHYKAGNYITLSTGFEAGGSGFFYGRLGSCPDIVSEPLISPYNTSSILVMDGITPLRTNVDSIRVSEVHHK